MPAFAALLAVLALRPALAAADCASPQVAIAPAPGSRVPADPVLHVFIPEYAGDHSVAVTVDGQPRRAEVRQLSPSLGFRALRVAVSTDAGDREIVVETPHGAFQATYVIDPAWRARSRAAVELRATVDQTHRWTCSFTDVHLLSLSPSPAYRVEYASTPAAWDDGSFFTAVFPQHPDDFWGRGAQTAGAVALGHPNCFAYNIQPEAMRGPLWVRVTGLLPDGSETVTWSQPVQIAAGAVVPTVPDRAAGPTGTPGVETPKRQNVALVADRASKSPTKTTRWRFGGNSTAFLWLSLCAALAALSLGLLVRALRRRAARRVTTP